jgi:hypothetical protein
MMSRGARLMRLAPDNHDQVPDGYFWCELFTGRHLSFDFVHGNQVLAVEGFRDDPARLDRFSRWVKVTDQFELPPVLKSIAEKYSAFNVEVIDHRVIEAHFRLNDDFLNHDSDEIIPVWKDKFYPNACGDRLGFILK